MAHTDVSQTLLEAMTSILQTWAERDGKSQPLYWLLRVKLADSNGLTNGARRAVLDGTPESIRSEVTDHVKASDAYWDNIRYATLDRVTQLWGTVVNAVRAAADTGAVTDQQRKVFDFPVDAICDFFRAARERMEVADAVFHAFKPMPAPECQALAALLNVHVDAPFDADLMLRLVRLLDAEGPLSEQESEALNTLSNTALVDAAFRGLRGQA